ncbi:carbonate dehydratase [Pseudalgibacter alginicilyticus]|uniref:Carbonic anhydrase n=1 Tax=Pseudalgibacter alginicilyticus TaxID=1736674 RepID=A0A0P0D8R2_9FLAO|nr:carbonic anhydrase family protein [Pseudalgibacter alginicilyticus]ALJ04243.1 carbonate dehydratase [Pseudalgibacter alginicilyticus]
MNTKAILLFCASLLLNFSCKHENKITHTPEAAHSQHWSYTGETSPEHWVEIEKNSDCNGKYQSPINIIDKDTDSVKTKDNLKILYSPTTLLSKVINNGHSIQFDFEAGDSISYKNEIFHLKQIHFHEPSEHKINGIIYPIEMHLVHLSKTGKITVLGILGEEGNQSPLFEFFESFIPLENGATKDIHQKIDLSSLFLEDKNYYSYDGSLTTPPCTENVNWVVFKQPIILSVDEVIKLKNNMPLNNYRNEQALNNRIVKLNY